MEALHCLANLTLLSDENRHRAVTAACMRQVLCVHVPVLARAHTSVLLRACVYACSCVLVRAAPSVHACGRSTHACVQKRWAVSKCLFCSFSCWWCCCLTRPWRPLARGRAPTHQDHLRHHWRPIAIATQDKRPPLSHTCTSRAPTVRAAPESGVHACFEICSPEAAISKPPARQLKPNETKRCHQRGDSCPNSCYRVWA